MFFRMFRFKTRDGSQVIPYIDRRIDMYSNKQNNAIRNRAVLYCISKPQKTDIPNNARNGLQSPSLIVFLTKSGRTMLAKAWNSVTDWGDINYLGMMSETMG